MAIITISRGTFSGGKELAECVADKLGYRCIARSVLVEAASDYGVSLDKLAHAIDEKPGILEGMRLDRVHYLAYIKAELTKEARDEKLVYHGHAGHLLLKEVPHILRVRVIANMDFRIETAMKRRNLSEREALAFIGKTDSNREKWTKFLYHVDLQDPHLYDIIIHLDQITIYGACDIVCTAAGFPEFQMTPESQKAISNMMLAAEIRAKIASDGHITDDAIEITACDGVVNIGGSVHSLADADRVRELVRQQPGVKEIESHLRAPITTRVGW